MFLLGVLCTFSHPFNCTSFNQSMTSWRQQQIMENVMANVMRSMWNSTPSKGKGKARGKGDKGQGKGSFGKRQDQKAKRGGALLHMRWAPLVAKLAGFRRIPAVRLTGTVHGRTERVCMDPMLEHSGIESSEKVACCERHRLIC